MHIRKSLGGSGEESQLSDRQALIEEIRALRKQNESGKSSGAQKLLGAFGKAIPKGIRHPDSLVSNSHLYLPGRRGKTRLR